MMGAAGRRLTTGRPTAAEIAEDEATKEAQSEEARGARGLKARQAAKADGTSADAASIRAQVREAEFKAGGNKTKAWGNMARACNKMAAETAKEMVDDCVEAGACVKPQEATEANNEDAADYDEHAGHSHGRRLAGHTALAELDSDTATVIEAAKEAIFGGDDRNGCDRADMDDDEVENAVRNAEKRTQIKKTKKVAGKFCMSGTNKTSVERKMADMESEIRTKVESATGSASQVKNVTLKAPTEVNGEVCFRAEVKCFPNSTAECADRVETQLNDATTITSSLPDAQGTRRRLNTVAVSAEATTTTTTTTITETTSTGGTGSGTGTGTRPDALAGASTATVSMACVAVGLAIVTKMM
jgi:hypothetical protein